MDRIIHVVMWIFMGAIVVLIVTHASGFATAVGAVGGQVTNDASLLAGYVPAQPGGTTSAKINTGGTGYAGAFAA